MKKFLVCLACLTVPLFAEMPALLSEDVNSLLDTYDTPTLTLISNELIQLAAKEEKAGDFKLASEHLKQAILIREGIGQTQTKAHASLLLFSSSIFQKSGNSCEASRLADKADQTFASLGRFRFSEIAKKDRDSYSKECSALAFK